MQYFSLLPNVFVGEGITDDEPYRYRLVKNLFRRTKLREDLDQYITLLETRIIPDGMRPEEVALQALGSPYLDWILLMVNEITDVYEQWPRSEERLLNYVQEKYDLPDGIHHYEITQASGPSSGSGPGDYSHLVECNSDEDGATSVSNRDYEQRLQDKYRQIRLLDRKYLNQFIDEFQRLIQEQ